MPAAPIVRRHSSSASDIGGTVDGRQGGRDSNTSNTNRSTLHRGVSSQHSLKRVDSPAVLRAEADKVFQVSRLCRLATLVPLPVHGARDDRSVLAQRERGDAAKARLI